MTRGQLDFGFASEIPARRKTKKTEVSSPRQLTINAAPPAAALPVKLFDERINVDVQLHNAKQAAVHIQGGDVEWTAARMLKLAGGGVRDGSKRLLIPTSRLDRLLAVVKPHTITCDAGCRAVGRALWAAALNWAPVRIRRSGRRLVASTPRWPRGWGMADIPWTAVTAMVELGLDMDVEENARALFAAKLARGGHIVAKATVSGSAVMLETTRREVIEALQLPALSYVGGEGSGRYKLPLLAAESLLREPLVSCDSEVKKLIKKASDVQEKADTPQGFPRELYPFQTRDLARGLHILKHTGGVLLAGEMGSGKTTISLAMVETLDAWPLLVVSPLAAFSTWQRQLNEMARSVHLCVGKLEDDMDSMREVDAVVVSYDRLHRMSRSLEERGFAVIVADEIQRIRTPGSRRSRALRGLAGAVPLRIGLSGTPVTNKAEDILPVGAFLVPGEWSARLGARELGSVYVGQDPLESLAEHLGTMMVRRRMEDTGAKLPGRHIKRVPVPLSADQRKALRDMEEQAREENKSGDLSNRIHIFAMLQRMRQIVNAPSAAGISGPNAKVLAAVDLAQEYSDRGRKSVVFVADRAAWREVGGLLDSRGIGWTGIWGSTPIKDRLANETAFHNDPQVKVFVGTLAACAESLTLSPTATVTIFASLSYSPSALAQAAARTYRMNQTNDVDEIYLHATAPGGTIDDRMYEILETKRHLIAQVVDRSEHRDEAEKVSLGDLVYMLTGERNKRIENRTLDAAASEAEQERRSQHARATLYRKKTGEFIDDGSHAQTLEQWDGSSQPPNW